MRELRPGSIEQKSRKGAASQRQAYSLHLKTKREGEKTSQRERPSRTAMLLSAAIACGQRSATAVQDT